MTHNYVVPELDLFDSNRKRLKTDRGSKQDEIRFYSPRYEGLAKTTRFHSPAQHNQPSNTVAKKEVLTNLNCSQPAYTANVIRQQECPRCNQYPTYYLDYEPQIYTHSPRLQTQCKCVGFEDVRRWAPAENDNTQKFDMYAQTSKLKQTSRQVQCGAAKIHDAINPNKQPEQPKGSLSPDNTNDHNPKPLQQETGNQRQYPNSVPAITVGRIGKQEDLEYNSSRSSNISKGKLAIPKSESSIMGPDYKKTFSQQILDELFEKDLQQEYELKYNKDKKYSEVIVGKMQKTVQVKTENTHRNQQNLDKHVGWEKKHMNGMGGSQDPRQLSENNRFDQINSSFKSPAKHKHLHNENTINMLVSGQHLTDKNSPVPTVDQTNQNSRNQVIQTDNAQSGLLIERLVQNVIDDKEFRKRINEKKDQFHRIKVDYQINPFLELQELIDSKDSYLQYSKEFLNKLTLLIENTTLAQRKKIVSTHHQPQITNGHPINKFQPPPLQQSVISAHRIPQQLPPRIQAPVQPPHHFIPQPFAHQGGFLPMPQYQAHPPPTQIAQQVLYRRFDPTVKTAISG